MNLLVRYSLVGTLALGGCGGAAGDAVRPKDLTASGATGTTVTCGDKPKPSTPLVVDLDSDTRVYLESAIKKGVTVVAYDCKSLKVLRGCTMPSTPYEYEGVSRKEDVLQLKSQDDLSVNLPLSAGKLGAEMSGGRTLDLALVRVGLQSTTVKAVDRAALQGNCEGATHYLSSVVVGAFSMGSGSAGKVSAAGELFKIGVSGKSSSTREASLHDGSIDSCRTSTIDDKAPPSECRSALRLELEPIGGEAATSVAKAEKPEKPKGQADAAGEEKTARAKAPAENPCPAGYEFSGAICTKVPGPAHLCKFDDEADCKEQCDHGEAGSCNNLGMLMDGKDGVPKKLNVELYKKSCDLGYVEGCGNAAAALSPYEVKKRTLSAFRDAVKYAKIGCDGGDGYACWQLGDLFSNEPDPVMPDVTDLPGAVKAFERGCRLGDAEACSYAADRYQSGQGIPKDPPRALALLERACGSNMSSICMELGKGLAKGKYGVPPDTKRGFDVALKECNKDPSQCDDAYDIAVLDKQSDEVLFDLASRHCAAPDAGAGGSGQDPNGCMKVARALAEGKGTAKDAAKAKALYGVICTEHQFVDACTAAKGAKPSKAPAKPKGTKPKK